MRRRAVLRSTIILLLFLTVLAGALGAIVRHEPAAYRDAALPPIAERKALSSKFFSNVLNLPDRMLNATDQTCVETFTADQMNSYFAEGLTQSPLIKLPESIHSPRVTIDQDQISLTFRYGKGFWSTVVTLDMNLWLVREEQNVIALEVQGFHAGALPVSPQSFMDDFSEALRPYYIDVTWYRHHGHVVALMRLMADRSRPTFLLEQLELQPGKIVIAGKSNEPGRGSLPPVASMLNPREP